MPASAGRGMQLHHRLVYVNARRGWSNHWYHFSAVFLTVSRRRQTPQIHQNPEISAGSRSNIDDGRKYNRSGFQMDHKALSEGCAVSVV